MENAQQKIIAGQLKVLLARLKSGRPLTAAHMRFVQEQLPGNDSTAQKFSEASTESDIVKNASELAQRLGIHRQTISFHRGRAGAPEALSVSAWREYLTVNGKLPTVSKIGKASPRGESYNVVFGDGLLAAHGYGMDGIGEILEVALTAAKLKANAKQRDTLAVWIWLLSAARVHRVAVRNECPDSPFSIPDFSDEDENDWSPQEIREAAKRIGFQLDYAREVLLQTVSDK
jgi:hypothetical protein